MIPMLKAISHMQNPVDARRNVTHPIRHAAATTSAESDFIFRGFVAVEAALLFGFAGMYPRALGRGFSEGKFYRERC